MPFTGEKSFMGTEVTECTIPISESLTLRLYSDTRPRNQHIADLQKGLILVYKGTELVGEGTGFGVPIVRYRSKTYFSGSAIMQIFNEGHRTIAVKEFTLDMIPETMLGEAKIENTLQRKLENYVEGLYHKHKRWRGAFETLKLKNLSKIMGLQTRFAPAKPVGNISVTYRIDPPVIHVRAHFNLLKRKDLQKVFLLNEQSSKYFRKFQDSNGTILFDEHIGPWEKVEADWACVSNLSEKISFRVCKVKGAVLRRGREILDDTLCWIGLDYEVSPEKTFFDYYIEIQES